MKKLRGPIVAYLRISKDHEGEYLGVDRQKKAILDLAERLGVSVTGWYEDNDISAFDVKKVRPAFQRLTKDVAEGRAGTVFVYHNDRLIRQPMELELWIRAAPDTSVYSAISGEYDLSSVDGRAIARILGAIAAKDSEHQSKRMKDKKRELAERGLPLGGPRPFGFEADGITVREDEAEAIKAGVRAILQGKSLNSVCRKWAADGLETARAGNHFKATTVRQILLRARNAGLSEYRGEIVGEAQWPALISIEEHEAILAVFADPVRKAGNNPKGPIPRWLGSGLYRCGAPGCGRTVVITGSGQRVNSKNYTCSGRKDPRRVTGSHPTRQAVRLDDLVGELIVLYLSAPKMVASIKARSADKDRGVDVGETKAELAAVEEKLKGLARQLADPGWTLEMVSEAGRALAERRTELMDRLGPPQVPLLASALAEEPDVGLAWGRADLETKRQIVRELMTVTILPIGKVHRQFAHGKSTTFDPRFIHIDWTFEDYAPAHLAS